MKNFLKYTLATIVGFCIVHFVLFLLFIAFIGALLTFSEKSILVTENSILKISLDTEILDRATNDPLENIDYLSISTQKSLGLNKILHSIKNATHDPRIVGIYLELKDIQGSYGSLAVTEEIRNALKKFKESGKFIYSYSNLGYSQTSYYLATVADQIFVNPETPLLLNGMSSSISFYKESLDKLGIQAEVVKVGKFKSAVEPFLETEISPANYEQVKKYLTSSWETIIEAISESRKISKEQIQSFADHFNIYPANQLKEKGFFDGVVYDDQMQAILKTKCNLLPNEKLNLITLTDYQDVSDLSFNNSSDEIAVIYAQGDIGFKQTNNSIGPELVQTIRKLREDQNVKAIVLRVNSPGGSALVSDIIWRETLLAKQSKPLIVSMGNVAASGGYYISCAADTIVAEETTLTGSIGIFGMFFNGEKLIENKLGIHTNTIKTNKYSDFGGSYPLPLSISSRPLNSYEKNILQQHVNQGYETFLQRVMQGRNLSREMVDSVAQGRVWTGKDALSIGLVDVIGGLEDAIRIAAEKADVSSYQITEYPIQKNTLEELMTEFATTIKSSILKEELGIFHPTWIQIKNLPLQQGVMARMPYDITIQ